MALKYGKYLLEKQLAIGGMAEVFLAHQEGPAGFRKTLCVKRILPNFANDAAFIDMFLDEARTAAQLSHPNIVQIYELGESDGSYYIAMEYIRGPSISKIIRRLKQANLTIPLHYAAKIVANICAGLEYAHTFADSEGQPLHLVHRDISPDNVLVSFSGAVKMIDFGIAKAKTNQSKTQAGAVKGKFSYMSPEQIMGSALDGRSDLFSLGIVLYELSTLRKPFGEDADLMTVSAIVNDPPPLPADMYDDYPPAMQSVILRALAKDRRERFSTAQEMQNELERFIHEQGEFLSERDIGNYMTRLFSQSPDDVETLRQLGSGIRMKLTGVPLVQPSTDVGVDEETVLAPGTSQTAVPQEPDTIQLEPIPPRAAASDDPDATRQIAAVSEKQPKKEQKKKDETPPTKDVKSADSKASRKPEPRPEPPAPRSEPGGAQAGGGGKKGLWIGVGLVGVAAIAVGLWFAFGRGGPPAGSGTTGGGSGPEPVAVIKDAGSHPEDIVAATPDAGSLTPDVAAASQDADTPPTKDAGSTTPDALPDAALVPPPDAQSSADAGPASDTAARTDAGPADAGPATSDAGQGATPDAGAVAPTTDVAEPEDTGVASKDAGATPEDAGLESADAGPPLPEGIQSGKVRVTSEPTMDVYWAGGKQGRTPLTLELPTGSQSLKLRGPDGLRKTLSFKVQANKQITASYTAVRGVVAFEAARGVLVFFDGVSLGAAPVKMRQAWEGEHSVEFRHPDGRRAVRSVRITKDDPKVLVRHSF